MITLTQRPLSMSRALHVLSSCVLCLAPPAVDLLEALCRCVYEPGLLLLFAYIAHLTHLLIPLNFVLGKGAPSLPSLGSCSKLLDVAHSKCSLLLRRLVCTRRACPSVCICRASAASINLLPRGWRAVAFARWLHVQSCSTWLNVAAAACVLASLALLVII